jgi:hypothetical protein
LFHFPFPLFGKKSLWRISVCCTPQRAFYLQAAARSASMNGRSGFCRGKGMRAASCPVGQGAVGAGFVTDASAERSRAPLSLTHSSYQDPAQESTPGANSLSLPYISRILRIPAIVF